MRYPHNLMLFSHPSRTILNIFLEISWQLSCQLLFKNNRFWSKKTAYDSIMQDTEKGFPCAILSQSAHGKPFVSESG